jgi:hypothetical protein
VHLAAKQFKRRKNAFKILCHLVDSDAHFAPVALRSFHKIKDILFNNANVSGSLDGSYRCPT